MQKQNRTVVTYKTLIGLAHKAGLVEIRTELVQLPTAENGREAIMRARVVLEEGGVTRTFEGTADATPQNVAPAMVTCLLRMAETRAKARALRDALSIGEAALEELGEYDEAAVSRTITGGTGAPSSMAQAKRATLDVEGPILSTQIAAIQSLCRQRGVEVPEMLSEYTCGQAAQLLKSLQQRAA